MVRFNYREHWEARNFVKNLFSFLQLSVFAKPKSARFLRSNQFSNPTIDCTRDKNSDPIRIRRQTALLVCFFVTLASAHMSKAPGRFVFKIIKPDLSKWDCPNLSGCFSSKTTKHDWIFIRRNKRRINVDESRLLTACAWRLRLIVVLCSDKSTLANQLC